MPRVVHSLCGLLCCAAVLHGGAALAQGTAIALVPASIQVDPGQEFSVDISIPAAGDPLNGYDAIVGFDPARLELILPVPAPAGEGALFTDACPQRFLDVQVAPDSTRVSVAHVLLCAGTSVTGPGVVYTLRFRARTATGPTWLRLLEGTAAYDAGSYVEPVTTSDAEVLIGTPTAAPPANVPARWDASPNPFNPATELRYDAPEAQRIRIDIFDVRGRAVATVFEGEIAAGRFRRVWTGRDRRGRLLASGVYLARLESSSGERFVTRLVLLR